MDYPKGLDPLISRQHLLHHTFSPLISIHATHNVDVIFQSITNNQNISTLQIFKPYGNNAKYSVPNQQYKILNTQLMTKNYASFPIRFEPSLPELLSILNAQSNSNIGGKSLNRLASSSSPTLSHSSLNEGIIGGSNSSGNSGTPLNQLFSISSLESYLRHVAKDNGKDMYLTLFDKMITSNQITPFETFNHPVSQIFIIDYETDSIEDLRKLIVNFRNFNFPKYFQIDDLMVHIFIIYDLGKFSSNEIVSFSNEIKNKLNLNCTIFPMNYNNEEAEEDKNIISLIENCTIEEDLQRISLNESNDGFQISKSIDVTIRTKLSEYINKFLIPHMQAKIRLWDDQMLQPKKSITGRFFLVSRKLFNSGNNSDTNLLNNSAIKNGGNNPNSSFNYQENYYYKSSSEQVLRKLADWSIMLKDFKYAYSTYEIIRKDYSNDRAWVYVASTQEMCIVSLLLAQTQQNLNPTIKTPVPDKNTLRKIRHDIIDPYMDNLSYTFKSRLNLKTFSFRTMIIVVELLLCMSQIFHISYWWYEMIEKYLFKLSSDFEHHLAGVMTTYNYLIIKAILHERLGYNAGRSIFLLWENYSLLQETLTGQDNTKEEEQEEEGMYVNQMKMPVPKNATTIGCTRYRKSALWYLLSMKQWKLLNNTSQIKRLFNNISLVYPENEDSIEAWYNRSDELLGNIKQSLE